MEQGFIEQARRLVRGQRARVTTPRLRVLAELLMAGQPLTHLDVQRRVEGADDVDHIDRVTVYRVLDWLVEAGLAHRVAGPDRVFRFSVQAGAHGAHGHFRCTRCERMFCMTETAGLARVVRSVLPEGFSGDAIELTVSGCCADCAAS
jgi:Fur family ferric uptake transcriptional regulator